MLQYFIINKLKVQNIFFFSKVSNILYIGDNLIITLQKGVDLVTTFQKEVKDEKKVNNH